MINTNQLTELNEEVDTLEDRLCKDMIYSGRSKIMDAIIDAMHLWMKIQTKYPKARMQPRKGQEFGDRIHRATFAVSIKMSGLLSSLEELIEKFDEEMEVIGTSTVNKGKVLAAIPGAQKILDQWANAWAMRLWLSDAKAKDDDKAKDELIEAGEYIVY
jgi:hypothetical protein